MAFDFGSLGAMASDRLRYIAVFTRTEPGFHQLAVRSNITSPTDLRGKKMGVVLGTQQHYVTVKYLQKIGVPLNTVQLVSFGSPLEIVASLRTGRIDAAWVFGNAVPVAKSSPGLRIIASDSEVLKQGLGLLIATRSFVQQKPAVLERFLAALVDAEKWVNTDPKNLKTSAQYIAGQIKAPAEGVLAGISSAQQTCSFTESDVAFLKDLATFKASLPSSGQSTGPTLNISNFNQYLALDALRKVNPAEVTVK